MPADPDQPAILAALAHHQAGRLADAERGYLAVLARRPRHPAALNLAGVAALQQGRPADAVARLSAAVAADPRPPDFHLNLGSALQALGDAAAAERCFATAVRLDPNLPEGHFNRGLALQRLGRVDEAEASVRRAVALRPRYPQALSTLAALLSVRQQFDAAAAAAQSALTIDPRHVPAYTALADVCRRAGDLTNARLWCERAIAVSPQSAEAHATLAVVLLLAGDFDAGWRAYQWRLGVGDQSVARQRFPGPMWDGSPLAGRTLLLWSEQGLGDAIQFVRFAQLIGGGRVIVTCPPPLVDVLRTAPGVDDVVAGPVPFDVHCPLGSLPFVLGTGGAMLTTPYLSVDPARAAAWRSRLGPRDRFRVGLVWAGSPSHLNDRNRSLSVHALRPLLDVPNVTFVSLQPGATVPPPVIDAGPYLSDLAETAAALAAVDLLVTVDSGVNHLAGAIGVPSWALLPFAPDWRWGLGESATGWYAAMRLFRQSRPGEWTAPVAKAAGELAAAIARRPPGGICAPTELG